MGRKSRYSRLVPNDNIYVIESADQLPSELDQWRIYHLLYDPGDGVGLYYSPDNLSLVKITSSGGILPVGTVEGSLLRWNTGSLVWSEFTAFILPAADGSATQILVTDGAGVVTWEPQGGGGGPAGSNEEIQWNDNGSFGADPHLRWDDTQDSLLIDARDAGSGDGAIEVSRMQEDAIGLLLNSINGNTTFHDIWKDFDPNNENSWRLVSDSTSPDRLLTFIDDPNTVYIQLDGFGQFGRMRFGGNDPDEFMFWDFTLSVFAIRNGMTIFMEEIAAALPDIALHGQIWVRDDAPNVLMFTDDVGTDFVLNAGGGIADGTVTNATLRWSGSAWVQSDRLQVSSAGIVKAIKANAIIRLETTGASLDENVTDIRMNNFSGFVIQSVTDSGFNGPFLMGANRTGSAWQELQIQTDLQIFFGDFTMEGGSIYMEEVSVPQADIADYGQFWVRDDVPNIPMFTNDAGVDFVMIMAATLGVNNAMLVYDSVSEEWQPSNDVKWDGSFFVVEGRITTGTGLQAFLNVLPTATIPNIVPNRFDQDTGIGQNAIDSMSLIAGATEILRITEDTENKINAFAPIFITEQAASFADVAGEGQVWVRDDAPNTLMYTDDAGSDFIVGGSPTGVYTRDATVVEDRTLLASASATTINNNNVLAALIADLQARGLLG